MVKHDLLSMPFCYIAYVIGGVGGSQNEIRKGQLPYFYFLRIQTIVSYVSELIYWIGSKIISSDYGIVARFCVHVSELRFPLSSN
jgi:hypothetical protein